MIMRCYHNGRCRATEWKQRIAANDPEDLLCIVRIGSACLQKLHGSEPKNPQGG